MFTFKESKNEFHFKNVPFQSDVSRSLSKHIEENINRVKLDLGDSADLIIRKETIGEDKNRLFAIIHIDGISDNKTVTEDIIEQILKYKHKKDTNISLQSIERIVSVSSLETQSSYTILLSALLFGETILLLDNETNYLILFTKMVQSRTIQEPSTQTVIRGPKDRYRLQHPALRIHSLKIGEITRTDVELLYIKGLTDENLVKEIKHRLEAINVDAILDTSYIEKYIKNRQMTVFPTVINTERPDAVVGKLLEGRIAIITAGSPFVISRLVRQIDLR